MSMSLKTDLCTLFDIKYPIILAGMAGISNMASLVAAVSNAGGLGTLGAAYMTPEEIQKIVREIKTLTPFPFSVNLFSTYAPDQYDRFKEVQQNLNKIRTTLGMDLSFDTEIKTPYFFKEQFQVVLEEQVPILSTTFGILPEEHMIQAKNKGIKIVTKITTVEEAKQAEQSGCDAIVAQGYEAGGHRGTFDILTRLMGAGIGTLALVPQVVDHINIPVIAAGGIMDGRGLVAALALGAQGFKWEPVF